MKPKAGEQINPDKIQIVWTTEDVLQVRPDLNKRQAREVLAKVKENHDAHIGVCWEVIAVTANLLFPKADRKEKKK